MNNTNYFLLSEFISTRICHDLAGASSAIANGVEFLSNDDDFADEAKDLIAMSSNAISSKIKLFRLAFGLLDKKLADFENIKNVLENYFIENNNIVITWHHKTPDDVSDTSSQMILGRIFLLFGMIAQDLLPRGGNLKIEKQANETKVTITSEKLIMNQELLKIISLINNNLDFKEIITNTTPKNIPLTYALLTASLSNFKINIVSEPTKLDLIISHN